ncbi:MAG: SCO family protein [Allomuricauda sp.]|nr:MAG: SCO family protein [Allomuricauda sp.]
MPTGASNKRKYNYIWVALVILVFGIIFIPKIVDRLAKDEHVDKDRLNQNAAPEPLGYILSNGEKRKVPQFRFLNQDSVWVDNKTYQGKVYLVDFFFTTCPTICPVMTKNLVDIQNTFSDSASFGVASFTINPRYDTPGVLKNYGEHYGVKDSDWNFLTGDQDRIYKLAREGFYILANASEDAPGGFEHSGMFALVDKEGYIRSRSDEFGNPLIYYRGTVSEAQGENTKGEAQQITILKEDIKKLLAE